MISVTTSGQRFLLVVFSMLGISACKDLTSTQAHSAPDAQLSAPAFAKGAGQSGADLVKYWKSPQELWVYDKRPELGVGVHPAVTDQTVSQLKAANIRTVRISLWWAWFAGDQQAYWDEMVPRLKREGIEVIGLLTGVPGTYNFDNREQAYQDFANFAAYVVDRYKSVRYWELFNEMDGGEAIFGAGRTDVSMLQRGMYYGQMLKLAYPAVKRANPNAWVLTGGMVDTNDFPRGIYQSGARDYFDFMAIHTYGDKVLGPFVDRAGYVKNVMKEFSDGLKPLINTEFGMSGGVTACVWMMWRGGLPHQQDPPQDDGTVFDNDQLENWRDPIERNVADKIYWKALPYQLKAGNDVCKGEIDEYAVLPPGYVGDDYGWGIFRLDGTTPRPAYTWLKDRNVNGALTSTQSTKYDVTIPAPEKLRPVGYDWVIRKSEMIIKSVPVNSLVPTVVRFQ